MAGVIVVDGNEVQIVETELSGGIHVVDHNPGGAHVVDHNPGGVHVVDDNPGGVHVVDGDYYDEVNVIGRPTIDREYGYEPIQMFGATVAKSGDGENDENAEENKE